MRQTRCIFGVIFSAKRLPALLRLAVLLAGISVLIAGRVGAQTLPVFHLDRRADAAYMDSIAGLARHQYKLASVARPTPQQDTLRFAALNYLGHMCCWWGASRRDSVLYFGAELALQARKKGNVAFEVKGILLSEFYYHYLTKDYSEAMRLNFRAREVVEKSGQDPAVGWRIDLNMGELYSLAGDYGRAIELLTSAQRLISQKSGIGPIPTAGWRADIAQKLAAIYSSLGQYEASEKQYLDAMAYAPTKTNLAYLTDDLAELYQDAGQHQKAVDRAQAAALIWQQMANQTGLAGSWATLAMSYAQLGQREQALLYGNKALATKKLPLSIEIRAHQALAKAYETQGEQQPGVYHFRRYITLRDSSRNSKKLTELSVLQKQKELEQLTLKNRQEQQLQAQRLATVEKQAELDNVRSKALAQAMSTRAILARQQYLLQGEQAKAALAQQQVRQVKQQQGFDQRALRQQRTYEAEKSQQQRTRTGLLLITLGTLIFATVLALFYHQNRRQKIQIEQLNRGLEQTVMTRTAQLRQANQELEQKNQLLVEVRTQIQATEMAALRAQMNPHFIFNCLNSIQYFTAQNDAARASDYLTKFSRLIRLVLENSRSNKVTLRNELETLRLFMEMETMRYGEKLRYVITVADEVDPEDLEIPPLLLQPYVENAIWHGLMHKEGGGTVRVAVSQPTPRRLQIEISDDGVGRAKAAEYKSKSATKSKSFGLQLTAERIELINQLYHTHTQAIVDDLLDEHRQPAGTRVVVEIPV